MKNLMIIFLLTTVFIFPISATAANLFYVYGNDVFENMPDGDNAYHPENYGSDLLGVASQTTTFYGIYNYYFITSYAGDIALIDAVQASDGTYLSSNITGNTADWQNSWGAPDGIYAHIGEENYPVNGGVLVLDTTNKQYTSITIYSTAVPVPGAAWLLGSGLVGLAGLRRKKTSSAIYL